MPFQFNFIQDDSENAVNPPKPDFLVQNDNVQQESNIQQSVHVPTKPINFTTHPHLLQKQHTLVGETIPFKFDHTGSPSTVQVHYLFKRSLSDVKYELALDDSMETENTETTTNTNDTTLRAKIEETMLHHHSDLLCGVYEGGLKTWECSYDLVQYLLAKYLPTNNPTSFNTALRGKRVLELGCGSALPGIMAMQMGASEVVFQDFNEEVIELVTIPNVLLNLSIDSKPLVSLDDIDANGYFELELPYSHLAPFMTESSPQRLGFYSGDWSNLISHLPHNHFDIILTSETIYHSDSYKSLISLLRHALTPTGVVYIAAKNNYFGCTGSLPLFLDAVNHEESVSGKKWVKSLDTVFVVENTVRREIVELVAGDNSGNDGEGVMLLR